MIILFSFGPSDPTPGLLLGDGAREGIWWLALPRFEHRFFSQ
jgi:hypothetical protein